MTLVDWRSRPAAELAACYDVERASWATRFDWETAENWRQVEQARVAGTLPGFVVLADGRPQAWSFFLRHRQTLQIGGLSLCTPDRAMSAGLLNDSLDAILASPDAAATDDAMTFTPDVGDGLVPALQARGFQLQRFAYLSRPLEPARVEATDLQSFHAGRLIAMSELLARAYPGARADRPFAPSGEPGEWIEYTAQLVTQTGCGTLLPWASVVEEDPARPGRLIGGILATRIGGQSAHLAQVAVDPAFQGQGKALRLLRASLARLADRGYTRVSLLVAVENLRAVALYERLGFAARGAFASAWRAQPRRSTSAACSTGGVSTLR